MTDLEVTMTAADLAWAYDRLTVGTMSRDQADGWQRVADAVEHYTMSESSALHADCCPNDQAVSMHEDGFDECRHRVLAGLEALKLRGRIDAAAADALAARIAAMRPAPA